MPMVITSALGKGSLKKSPQAVLTRSHLRTGPGRYRWGEAETAGCSCGPCNIKKGDFARADRRFLLLPSRHAVIIQCTWQCASVQCSVLVSDAKYPT